MIPGQTTDPPVERRRAPLARILSSAGWEPVEGQPSLFLRSNAPLLSALRCTLTATKVTVEAVSMTFAEDRPLQLVVQPRGPEGFAPVCEVLARHAPRLDRLDYEGCVAELLAHVPEVLVECESSGLVPTVARRQAGQGGQRGLVHYEPAPLPAWPPSEPSRRQLNERRRGGDGDSALLPWGPAQHKELPRLLAKDRRRSLGARLAYYDGAGLLRPGDGFVRTIESGRHVVWFPGDDSKGAFAYSIGLAYLHDLPEILLVSPTPGAIGATSRALALTVNAIAAAMVGGGRRLQPGDRYAAVADVVARTVHKDCTLDHATLAQSCFVIPSARIAERTLGSASWFHANFMDAASFPVLACLLQPPRVPANYGVPPPPPPPKAPVVATPVKAKRAATPAKRKPKTGAAKKAPAKKSVKKPAGKRPRRS
jgi:hypothetical protein